MAWIPFFSRVRWRTMCARRATGGAGRGLVVGSQHEGQKARGEQLYEYLGVDLDGLNLRLGDRPGLRRVRDDYARDVTLEQPRDRVGVASRL